MSDDLMERIAKLERELAELKAQQTKQPTTRELLDAAAKKRMSKYDPTEGFRLPASAAAEMAAIVPDPVGSGFDRSAWARTKPGEPGGFGPSEKRSQGEGLKSWPKPIPIESPPGIRYCDQMVDVADELDRRELERRLGTERFVRRI